MTDFFEFIQKDTKIQNDVSNIVDKDNNQSYATKSILGKNALIQSSIYKEAINIMGDTINDMDVELNRRTTKYRFWKTK